MINKSFSSISNKNAIKSVINENIYLTFKTNINNNFDDLINDTMQYVSSQVSPVPPKGVDKEEYLFLMNKKVYDIVTPVIKQNIEAKNKKDIVKSNKDESQFIGISQSKIDHGQSKIEQNIFDPLLLKQFETPPVIEYPKPGAMKSNNESTDFQIKNMENERSVLTPKIKPIDFSIKDKENRVDTKQLYNELLINYNTQTNSMLDFDSNQKKINSKIESIEISELNNTNSFTPIDLLNKENDSSKFFNINENNSNFINKDISTNVAFNRNDAKSLQNLFVNEFDDSNVRMQASIETFTSNIEEFIPSDIGYDDKNNFNNDINSYSRSQTLSQEFSSFNDKNQSIMLEEPKYHIIEKKFYVIFDSKDRDLYEYPNPTSFQVKFSPAGNNFKYESYYDTYNTLIINEKNVVYGDGSNLSVDETYDNIKDINCKCVNVPTNIIYIGSSNPQESTTGVPLNIFKDSYVFLVIPELRGPYRGGGTLAKDSFAKLLIDYASNINTSTILSSSIFTTLKTADDETFINNPVTIGKIDIMTLNLVNKNGILYNFGIDKLFINSFSEGTMRYDGYCGKEYLTTIINIQNKNSEYSKYCSLYSNNGECNILNSHPINISDLLYFYNTMPNSDQIVFVEDYVNISKLKYTKKTSKLQIYLTYSKIINGKDEEISVDFRNIIPGASNNNSLLFKNYYIVLFNSKINKNYFLNISSFGENYISVDYSSILPQYKDYSSLKIGIAKSNLRGNTDNYSNSLFRNYGYRVLSVGTTVDTQWQIEVDFPYKNLPEYYKDSIFYNPGSVFLIQDKLQLSYTFTITTMIKDYKQLNSGLNGSGTN
jgi:hypothetical protein